MFLLVFLTVIAVPTAVFVYPSQLRTACRASVLLLLGFLFLLGLLSVALLSLLLSWLFSLRLLLFLIILLSLWLTLLLWLLVSLLGLLLIALLSTILRLLRLCRLYWSFIILAVVAVPALILLYVTELLVTCWTVLGRRVDFFEFHVSKQDEYTSDTQTEYESKYDVENHVVGSLLVSTLVYRCDDVFYKFAFKDKRYRTYNEHHYTSSYEIAKTPVTPKNPLEYIP